jgi:hypothetical protein
VGDGERDDPLPRVEDGARKARSLAEPSDCGPGVRELGQCQDPQIAECPEDRQGERGQEDADVPHRDQSRAHADGRGQVPQGRRLGDLHRRDGPSGATRIPPDRPLRRACRVGKHVRTHQDTLRALRLA